MERDDHDEVRPVSAWVAGVVAGPSRGRETTAPAGQRQSLPDHVFAGQVVYWVRHRRSRNRITSGAQLWQRTFTIVPVPVCPGSPPYPGLVWTTTTACTSPC